MKTILVCCGSSMITSSVAINKLKEAMAREGIEVKFLQGKFADVPSLVESFKPDIIVPTGVLDEKAAGGVPIVRGTCFITGVGILEMIAKVVEILKGVNGKGGNR